MHTLVPSHFDPTAIIKSGQCFRAKETAPGTYQFFTGRHTLSLTRLSPKRYDISCSRYTWNHTWRPYFDFTTNYDALHAHIPKDDDFLQAAAQTGTGIRILRQDPWEMVVTFIISQRKTIPAITRAVESLSLLAGKEVTNSRGERFHTFPTPQALARCTTDELRSCGLGYRAPYLFDTAHTLTRKKYFLRDIAILKDDELVNALQTLPGVGIKVASCVALFAYHRLGVAPIDVWIQKVIDQEYGGQNPFPAYGPYAGLYQQYMFYHIRETTRRGK